MKFRKTIYMAVLAAGLGIGGSSCSDYLDISKELTADLSIEEIFDTPKYTRQWHANIYNCISEYSEMGSEMNAFRNPWANLCGEITSESGSSKNVMTAGYTAANASYHRWSTLYMYIRQAMIFIERGKPIGSGKEIVDEAEIAKMKDEARFFIAYSYFCLFELYGPVPIVNEIDDAAEPKVFDYMRPSVDEMVTYIDDTLKELVDPAKSHLNVSVVTGTDADGRANSYNLQEAVRPTQITAKALRAKLWVYAASPLFNGGYGTDLKDKDGKNLFPVAKDKTKWEKAKSCLEDLLTAAEAAGHRLYRKLDSNEVLNVNVTLYELFQNYTEEILWCTPNNDWSTNSKMEKRTTPRDIASSYGNMGPSQESVDMFFMSDGLTKDESASYKETGFSDVANPDNGGKSDKNIFNMYANREPRFYRDVLYQGRSWFANYMALYPQYSLDFSKDGGAGPGGNNSRCGYMISKFKNTSITFQGSNNSNIGRPSILFRLADFYLYYAEALNEINPADSRIVEYIDKVRERAGIPTYTQLAGKKSIANDYAKQLKAIQQERFVELFCEGQRYFDIRRWMICGSGQDADQSQFHGMDQYGDKTIAPGMNGSFFKRTSLENRIWNDKMYLYPIPQNTVNLSEGLIVQNPGW